MSDLGPLLAAVTDEWERGKTIAKRAGVTGREATAGLGVLVRRGDIDSQLDPTETFALYRRGPKAPPFAVPFERRILPAANTLVAIGSIVRHVEEMLSPDGHDFDRHAVEALVGLEGVQAWLAMLDALALLPVRRGS